VIGPTPLLDFFKRGEVARDVRLEAAQGTLAPRAYEQLSILVLLLEDPDREIRELAEQTLSRIPEEAIRAFLGRSDTPIGLREFFGDRGIFPDEILPVELDAEAGPSVDAPLIDAGAPDEFGDDDEDRETALQKLTKMTFTQRLKAAMRGSREMRAILIRDSNKMIAAAVLSSPKLSGPEIEAFAKMPSISEEILRMIATNRAWTKSYNVLLGLTKNPKTPLVMTLNFMNRLSSRDLQKLAVDRNVPEPLRMAARKRVVSNTSGSS
jgi:hypothetical protein